LDFLWKREAERSWGVTKHSVGKCPKSNECHIAGIGFGTNTIESGVATTAPVG